MSGRKAGNAPYRGNASMAGRIECPLPNRLTRPPFATPSAMSPAARSIVAAWVAVMRSTSAAASRRYRMVLKDVTSLGRPRGLPRPHL